MSFNHQYLETKTNRLYLIQIPHYPIYITHIIPSMKQRDKISYYIFIK